MSPIVPANRLRSSAVHGPVGRNAITTTDPLMKEFFRALYKSGMSQEEFAKKVGITTQSVSRYKHGVATPTITMVTAMAQVLGYKLKWEKLDEV